MLWFLVCVGFVHFSRDATCLVFCACRCRSGQTQATVLTPTCGPTAGAPALPGERRRSPQEGVLPRQAVRTSAPQGVAPAAGLMPPGDPLAPGQPRTGGGLTWLGSRGTPGRNAALPARRPTLQLEGAPRVGREPGSVGVPQGFSVSGWFWTCQSVAPHRDLPGGAGLSRPPARTAGRCGLGPRPLSAHRAHGRVLAGGLIRPGQVPGLLALGHLHIYWRHSSAAGQGGGCAASGTWDVGRALCVSAFASSPRNLTQAPEGSGGL